MKKEERIVQGKKSYIVNPCQKRGKRLKNHLR